MKHKNRIGLKISFNLSRKPEFDGKIHVGYSGLSVDA
jgi:hypothetical protein